MIYYLFPFDKVPKGSRIVLYGAGNVGEQFYEQVIETNFCEIVLWLDKNANGILANKPGTIASLNFDDYDTVIIAIENELVAHDVKVILMDYGVPETKILHHVHCSSEFSKLAHKNILHKFYVKTSLQEDVYEHLIKKAHNLRFSAQFSQDIMSYLFFNGKKDGFYIEIGAHDGYNGSTTYWAEQLGWNGICVEPQKKTFEQLRKCRNCTLYNFAISDKTQKDVEFITFPEISTRNGISSTMSRRHIEEAKKLSSIQATTIDTITFDDMMKDFPNIAHVDFLSIDTEGHEMNVLRSIDFNKYSFGFITIETGENSDVVEFVEQKGYKVLLTAGSDVIFVPNAYQIKQICCISPFNCENKYIELMKTALRHINIEPVPQKDMDIANFIWYHWVEDSYEDPTVLLQINSLAAAGKKIIWSFHNRLPHEVKDIQKAKLFIKSMINIAYKIIIHNNSTVNLIKELCDSNSQIPNKIIFVPHPCYTGIYGFEKTENYLQSDKLKLCFLGIVRKYKNIEILISTIKELNYDDVELSIYGRGEVQYLEYLHSLIGKYSNIKTCFRFIPDKEIPEVLANCHLFVLPYDLDSSLNSGATLLAFSYGRTVLSPLTGTLSDIENQSFFFSYSYRNSSEHKEELKKQIVAIREKYKGNYTELLNMGNKAKQYVTKHHSLELVEKQLANVF